MGQICQRGDQARDIVREAAGAADLALMPIRSVSRDAASGSLSERAYVAIRDQLIHLEIPPGALISEDALISELGMGRTPIREAIKRLALESLIDVFPRRGTFAADIQITDLAAISEVRVQLEAYAASLAAQRTGPAQQGDLDELLLRVRSDIDDPAELMAIDADVHRFVYKATRNSYLEETLHRYLNLSLRIWCLVRDQLPRLGERVHEHEAVLLAIRDGDAERAGEVAARHVDTFEREIRAVL